MTHNDPCDELSDGLTEALLLDVRYRRMKPEQRRHVNINAVYGSLSSLRNEEYMRLHRAFFTRKMGELLQSSYTDYFARALRKLELNSDYKPASTSEPRFYVADQGAAVTQYGTEHLRDLISNPAIVIEPKRLDDLTS